MLKTNFLFGLLVATVIVILVVAVSMFDISVSQLMNFDDTVEVQTIEPIVVDVEDDGGSKNESQTPSLIVEVPEYAFRATLIRIVSEIKTATKDEVQVEVKIFENEIGDLGTRSVTMSSLGCDFNTSLLGRNFLFSGVTYDSKYGWYTCTQARAMPSEGIDQ